MNGVRRPRNETDEAKTRGANAASAAPSTGRRASRARLLDRGAVGARVPRDPSATLAGPAVGGAPVARRLRPAQAVSLGFVLYAVWLLLSGHFEPLLLGLGVISCIVVVLIARRMEVLDREGHPIHLMRGAFGYWPWLLWEIVKSNVDVARRILRPSLPISPTLVRLTPTQKSDLGLVVYANSITLTPGTITIDVEPGSLLVHAIAREGAESLAAGEMDRRVTRMMGEG